MDQSVRRSLQRQLTQQIQPRMAPAEEPGNVNINMRNGALQYEDKKTTYSRRDSYKYKMPILDPAQIQALKKFLVIQKKEEDEKKKQYIEPYTTLEDKIKKYILGLQLGALSLIGMVFFQVFLFVIYFVAIFTIDETSRRIGLGITVVLACIAYCFWVWYLSIVKEYVDQIWLYVWGFCLINVMGGAIAGAANVWYISFIFSGIIIIAFSVMFGLKRNKISTIFIIIFFTFYFFTSSFQIAIVIPGPFTPNFVGSIQYIVLFVFGELCIAYQLVCKKKWKLRTKQQKWGFICQSYIYFCFLFFGLALGVPGKLGWVYMTQGINAVFICCILYYLFNVVGYKCTFFFKQQKKNPNILYQMAQGMLTNDSKFFTNPRQSIVGKPLAQCTNCLSEQSRFYYQNCKHVCVGHQCVLDWIKRSIKKCPLCREVSLHLIQVKRTRELQFQIQNKYKFP